ncbi:hypothetical protein ACXR0O_15250 [Verrucomicrobiota bacterium sgz303538]
MTATSHSTMDTNEKTFSSALSRFQRRWRLGLLLAGGLRALFWAGIALLLFGVLDYYTAFSDSARHIIGTVLALTAGCGAMWALWQVLLFIRRDAAVEADRALGGGRREVLSALELEQMPPSVNSLLSEWLRTRAVHTAAGQLVRLDNSRSLPTHRISRGAKQLATLLVVFVAIAIAAPRASWTIARRLLQPHADIPPYTPLQFSLGPQPAQVLYGGELIIAADITGGKLEAPVRCLTRDPATGQIEDSPAFNENASRFSRKLEKVAAPVDVAFVVGRARSAWLPVSVLMQPKVQDVVLTIDPPTYSGLPRREFTIGSQDLAAIPGSRITARISSNRPLGSGTLRIYPTGANDAPQEVAGTTEDTHRLRFSWIVRQPARLAAEIRDVLGTASEQLQLEQKVTQDERPQVVLRQPAGDVLATPDSELPLEASANDDLGLTRVTLVRQLSGYRERSAAQAVKTGERRHDVTGKLSLSSFGLVPGQVIELTLEAGDTNPNLLGVSVSEPARVHVIAREQYAQMLRDQVTLEDFSGRYTAMKDALEEARKAIEELEKAAQSGDAPKAEEARKKAMEAHRNAGQVFGQLAKDFPLFDLDHGLAKASQDAMRELFENAKQLEDLWRAQPKELLDALPQLKERLGSSEKDLAQEMQKGERAMAAANVFEQAGKFRERLEEQRQIVKDFNRTVEQIRRGETQAGQALRDLAKRQQEVADGMRQLEKELEGALNGLPEEFAKMQEEGRKFIQGLQEMEIAPTMDEGATAAESGDGKTANDRASEALAKMEALLRRKNGFCEMCRGEGEQSFPWPQDLSQTLQQLMRSLIQKRSGQQGEGDQPDGGTAGSGGFGGRSDSGYTMKGKMPQLPIYGPSRMRFSHRSNPQLGAGNQQGNGSGKGRPEDGSNLASNQIKSQPTRDQRGEALAVEAVPEAYREAVKRYFSTDENQRAESVPTTQSSKP